MTVHEVGPRAVLDALVQGARDALGDDLVGAYQVGSFALGAGDAASDVDFLVVVRARPTPVQERALRQLHALLPDLPAHWAHHLEGSYAPVTELRHAPAAGHEVPRWLYVDNGDRRMSWSTHDNSLVTRWIARERGLVLAGPPARDLVEAVTPEQLSADARRTLAAWDADLRARPDQFADVLSQQQHVLGLCRLLHRVAEGVVLSKVAAAQRFLHRGDGRWHRLVQAAVDGRARGWARSAEPVSKLDLTQTLGFHHHVVAMGGVVALGGVVAMGGRLS